MKTISQGGQEGWQPKNIFGLAQACRRNPTPLEFRFWKEAKARFPKPSWRRYAPVMIQAHQEHKSVWYAPFLCEATKLILIINDRPDFPYRLYGQNRNLYARHGYTVLDFSEDFSCDTDASVWEGAMAMVETALKGHR